MIISIRILIKDKAKNIAILFLRIIAAVVLLFLLINYIDFNEIVEALKKVNSIILIVVFTLIIPNIYFQFLKWKLMCNKILDVHDNKKIWLSLFLGFTGGIITPIRFGEYFARLIPFKNLELSKITISTFVEKMATFLLVIFIGSIGTAFYLYFYYSSVIAIIIIAFLFFIIIFSSFQKGYLLTRIKIWSHRLKFLEKIWSKVNFLTQLNSTYTLSLFIFSFLFYCVYILQFALLVLAFNNEGNLLLFIWAGIVVMFLKNIFSFFSFADLGIRESASVFVLSKMGIHSAIGFNAAIFMFLFNLIIPSLIGAFLIIRIKK